MNALTRSLIPLTLLVAACSPTPRTTSDVSATDAPQSGPALQATETFHHDLQPIDLQPPESHPAIEAPEELGACLAAVQPEANPIGGGLTSADAAAVTNCLLDREVDRCRLAQWETHAPAITQTLTFGIDQYATPHFEPCNDDQISDETEATPDMETPLKVAALFGTHRISAEATSCLLDRGPAHHPVELINSVAYCGLLGTFLDATTDTSPSSDTRACLNNQRAVPIDLDDALHTCTGDQP